jgi:hypothetical protein
VNDAVRGGVRILVCALLIVSSAFGNPGSASLQNTGSVTVNGKWTGPASTMFLGDRLQVGHSSTSVMTTEGSLAVVGANTSLILAPNEVDMSCGTILVRTTTSLAVRLADLVVKPENTAEAKFEVSPTTKGIRVTSRQGAIRIDDGGSSQVLEPGNSILRPGRNGCGVPLPVLPAANAWVTPVAAGSFAAAVPIGYCSANHWCDETPSPHVP